MPEKPPVPTDSDPHLKFLCELQPSILRRYFHGQMLTGDGLERAQLAMRKELCNLARLLGGHGVLEGLQVREQPEPSNGMAKLSLNITPGVAIDPLGRLIIVPEQGKWEITTETLEKLFKGNKSPDEDPPEDGEMVQGPNPRRIEVGVWLLPSFQATEETLDLSGPSDGTERFKVSEQTIHWRIELRVFQEPRVKAKPDDSIFKAEPEADFHSRGRPAEIAKHFHRKAVVRFADSGVLLRTIAVICETVPVQREDHTSSTRHYRFAEINHDSATSEVRQEIYRLQSLESLLLRFSKQIDATLRWRTIRVISGNAQTCRPGEPLAEPIVLEVVNSLGQGVKDVALSVTATNGPGEWNGNQRLDGCGTFRMEVDNRDERHFLSTLHLTTNQHGRASFRWKLGDVAGLQSAEIRFAAFEPGENRHSPGSLHLGTASCVAVASSYFVQIVSGNSQQVRAGHRLPAPLRVRVTDQFGHPVAGVKLNCQPAAGGNCVNAQDDVTNGEGILATDWTLSTILGRQTLRVELESGPPHDRPSVEFEAVSLGPVLRLEAVSQPFHLKGPAPREQTLVVRVVEMDPAVTGCDEQAASQPVANIAVEFRPIGPGDVHTHRTGFDGKAEATFPVGTGATTVQVLIKTRPGDRVSEPLLYLIEGCEEKTRLIIRQKTGDLQSGNVREVLTMPLQIEVVGPNNLPAVGIDVLFEALSGSGSLQKAVPPGTEQSSHPRLSVSSRHPTVMVRTNSAGIACVDWQLGGQPGRHFVRACLMDPHNLDQPHTLFFHATAREPCGTDVLDPHTTPPHVPEAP